MNIISIFLSNYHFIYHLAQKNIYIYIKLANNKSIFSLWRVFNIFNLSLLMILNYISTFQHPMKDINII